MRSFFKPFNKRLEELLFEIGQTSVHIDIWN
jgi:hypothetical protein